MPKTIPIQIGDCVDSLAYEAKVKSDAVWDDPANGPMKLARQDRNVLMPGETITIPDPEIKWETNKHTALTHIFKRKLPTKEFRFQLCMGTAILAPYRFKIEIDGLEVPGNFATGWVSCQIKPNAKVAVITLYHNRGKPVAPDVAKVHKYTIKLGCLRPVNTPEGQEDRLRNLGYLGPLLHKNGVPTFAEAFRLFQLSYGIDPAAVDAATLTTEKLKELTGDPN